MQQSAHGSTLWHSLQISSSQMQITLALIKQVYRSLFLLFTFLKLSVPLSSTLFPYPFFLLFHLPSTTSFFLILHSLFFHLPPFSLFFLLYYFIFTFECILASGLYTLHFSIPPQQYHEGQLSRADASLSFLIFERMS